MKKLIEFIPFRRKLKRIVFNTFIYFQKPATQPLSSVELYTLLCHQHVGMFLYCIDSFVNSYKHSFPINIIDDGTLTPSDYSLLIQQYGAKIYTKEEVLGCILPLIRDYPNLTDYLSRKDIVIKNLKIASLLLSQNKRVILEPDILFNSKSPAIDTWITQGTQKMYLSWDSHVHTYLQEMYLLDVNFRKLIIQYLQLNADYSFNGGLLFLPKKISKRELFILDKACKLFNEIEYIDNPWCEEVLLMLLINKKYDITLNPDEHKTIWSYEQYYKTPKNFKLLHYAGDTKGIMESDAIKYILGKNAFF